MEKTLVQLPLFQEDSLANPSQQREREEEQTMIATSGMKLLELLPSANRGGLLAKMLKGLLTSKTAWCSDRCKMIWKERVSKSNVLLFQLQASVRGIKEKEFGLLATPNTMDHLPPRSKKGTLKLQQGHRKGRTRPSNLREQVDPQTMAMYPTPTPACEEGGEQSHRVERTKSGGFILRKKNKTNQTYGAKLSDAMLYLERKKMYPTPVTKDNCTESLETWEKRAEKHKEQGKKIPKALRIQVQEEAKSMYPTPNARDWKDTVNTVPPSVNKTRGYSLGMKVAQEKVAQTMYPTPTWKLNRATNRRTNLKEYYRCRITYQD